MCKRVFSFRISLSSRSTLSPLRALLRTTRTARSSITSSQRSEYKLFHGIFILIFPHVALSIDNASLSFPSALYVKAENKASWTTILLNSTSFNSKIPSDNAISIDARLSVAPPSSLPIILLNARFSTNFMNRLSAHSLALNTTIAGAFSKLQLLLRAEI